MKSSIVKRSIVIGGHKTSVSLEDPFWTDLKAIAHAQQMKLSELVAKIDDTREQNNLSSAIRLFVLNHVRTLSVLNKLRNEEERVDVAKARLSPVDAESTPATQSQPARPR